MAPTADEAALGALLGACVGDAAGVTLEFSSSDLIKPAAASSPFTMCMALFWAMLHLVVIPTRKNQKHLHTVSPLQVAHALTLPGGRVFGVGPGQVDTSKI